MIVIAVKAQQFHLDEGSVVKEVDRWVIHSHELIIGELKAQDRTN